ncbi:condensin subunit Cnd3 [Coprinopsis marcescibilis]|uniref:Condensin subunit Cnd3 n=1 Tax=Coprinopsis marcescibilis TaxID=230819 RepID=A0A5C3L0W1_COPMA|nr:condensin subunit Cnd3 [Coprinopsis marcescibilis]
MAKSTEPYNLEDLFEAIATIFDQVQQSLANHKKNCVALYKLHQRAATVTKNIEKKNGTTSVKYVGEKALADAFLDMINRVLVIKKGPPAADRIVKFVGSYVQYLNEKAIQEAASSTSDEAEETTTTRFVARTLGWLLEGFPAKNKNVRFRCLHLVSELISHIGEVDEDTYNLLREGLVERLNDKEPIIRANAAAALSKLVGSEDPDEIETGEQSVLDILLEVMGSDPTADVRRAALLNVPLTAATINAILQRTRDVDTITRKIMYTAVLPKLSHPRELTLVQREQVVKDGLGDREPGVRVAAGKLLAKWFETVHADPTIAEQDPDAWVGDDGGLTKACVAFLDIFDVIGAGETIAVDAITCIFVTRPDIPDAFVFPELYWKQLTPESAVVARVFVEHCVKTNNERRLESASLPVVTAFAFHIQEAYNRMLGVLEQIDAARVVQDGESEELEEDLAKCEVVLGELLRMALKLDYMDEIGRRKVFTVVKDMLAHPQLPPGLIERCVDVLKEIMPSERDLIRMVVEIIVELRENEDIEETENLLGNLDDDDDQSNAENTSTRGRAIGKPKDRDAMSAEDRREADLTDIRCLLLCIAVLERINGSFEDNSTLEGILSDLIIPSVKRKELAMREKALVSLGLCCLIAKLFLGQVENASPEIKVQVLRVILDLLIMYDAEFFKNSEGIAQQVTGFLLQTLQNEDLPQAQAVLCTGICKLLLAGIITDTTLLVSLLLLYISPTTADNQELRQCLSYFFPVYSYASYDNQSRIASIFVSAYDHAVRLHGELEEEQDMISPGDFCLMLVDWTDPAKAVQIANAQMSESQHAHADLAIHILTILYDEDRNDEDKKVFCQALAQIQLPATLNDLAIHKLDLLISNQESQCPFENTAIEKLFSKIKTRFHLTFQERLQKIDPVDLVEDESVLKVYNDIAVKPPKADPSRKAKKAAEAAEQATQNVHSAETSAAPVEEETEAPVLAPAEPSAVDEEEAINHDEPQESAEEEKDEESAAEEPIETEERPSTPLQTKGIKRAPDTPGTSRDDRKRTRTKRNPVDKPKGKKTEESDVERSRSPTPVKKTKAPVRKAAAAKAVKAVKPTTTRATGRTGVRRKVKEPSPELEIEESVVGSEASDEE